MLGAPFFLFLFFQEGFLTCLTNLNYSIVKMEDFKDILQGEKESCSFLITIFHT